jgi:sec-independent protein translocase protein TatA
MFGLSPTELVVIAVIVLLIFGAKRLPEIGKGLGGAIKEFKKVKKDISRDVGPAETGKNKEAPSKPGNARSLESQVAGKVLEQIPGVKKVLDVKDKADKIKDLMK